MRREKQTTFAAIGALRVNTVIEGDNYPGTLKTGRLAILRTLTASDKFGLCWWSLQTDRTQIRPVIRSGLIWIETVWHSDSVPEQILTLNAPIATKVVCFSRLLKRLRSKQCGPRSDCSYRSYGSTLFASILYLSVMLGNYLQQTTSAEDIFRCIFFLAL